MLAYATELASAAELDENDAQKEAITTYCEIVNKSQFHLIFTYAPCISEKVASVKAASINIILYFSTVDYVIIISITSTPFSPTLLQQVLS